MKYPPRAADESRRLLLKHLGASASAGTMLLLGGPAGAADGSAAALIRRGGLIVAFRHADAPGTFDPPGFKPGVCSTQRNLGEAGRAQARRIGAWFREHGLKPRRVRSSPWCRCLDTATLAFGEAQAWEALGSMIGVEDRAPHLAAMRQALHSLPADGFEVWVSHQVTLGSLTGENTSSGEGLLFRAAAGGAAAGDVQMLGRLSAL